MGRLARCAGRISGRTGTGAFAGLRGDAGRVFFLSALALRAFLGRGGNTQFFDVVMVKMGCVAQVLEAGF